MRPNADKRHSILTLLNDPEWVTWADREIGRQCAVDHMVVVRLRTDMTSGAKRQIPDEPRRVSRGGTEYVQKTANIGKAKAPAESLAAERTRTSGARWRPLSGIRAA